MVKVIYMKFYSQIDFQLLNRYAYVFIGSIGPSLILIVTYKVLLSFGLTQSFVNTYNFILNGQLLGGITGSAFASSAIKVSGASAKRFAQLWPIHIKVFTSGLIFYSFLYVFATFGNMLYISVENIFMGCIMGLIVSYDIYLRSWFIGSGQFGLYALTTAISSFAISISFIIGVLFAHDHYHQIIITCLIMSIALSFHCVLKYSTDNSVKAERTLDFKVSNFVPLVISGLFINLPFILLSDYFKNTSTTDFNRLSVSLQIFSVIVFLPNIVVKVMSSQMMWSFGVDHKGFYSTFVSSLKYAVGSLFFILLLLFPSAEFINAVYDGIYDDNILALYIWMGCAALAGAQYPMGTVILAAGKYWFICFSNLIWFISILSIFLFFEKFNFGDLSFFLILSYFTLLFANVLSLLLIFNNPSKIIK